MTDFLKAIGFVRDISNTAKRFADKREEFKINEVAIQLQGITLDLQTEMMTIQAEYQNMLRTKEELEDQLEKQKNWEKERARYMLKDVGSAIFVYALKQGERGEQPPHWICPNCYENAQKSILQKNHPTMFCPRCNFSTFCLTYPSW